MLRNSIVMCVLCVYDGLCECIMCGYVTIWSLYECAMRVSIYVVRVPSVWLQKTRLISSSFFCVFNPLSALRCSKSKRQWRQRRWCGDDRTPTYRASSLRHYYILVNCTRATTNIHISHCFHSTHLYAIRARNAFRGIECEK